MTDKLQRTFLDKVFVFCPLRMQPDESLINVAIPISCQCCPACLGQLPRASTVAQTADCQQCAVAKLPGIQHLYSFGELQPYRDWNLIFWQPFPYHQPHRQPCRLLTSPTPPEPSAALCAALAAQLPDRPGLLNQLGLQP